VNKSTVLFGKNRNTFDPFTDLLFNALLGFTFLFLVAILFMNPVSKSGIVSPKAEYIVTVNWPDNNPDDIDIWVEDPVGNLIWFRNREAGLVHLDRDDRGVVNDQIEMNGQTVETSLNQEVVTIRGRVTGEYVINLHYYESKTNLPVKASVEVAKINPAVEIIYYGETVLKEKGVEETAVRFSIADDGSVNNVNRNKKSIIVL
jgi:hypothetical protein|tara:strand:+ start:257 stop:865 length:609 start_codon:yes stop_codon:yes gene_type:complete